MKLMDRDVEDMAGPKGRHNPNRVAYRHGFQATTVPMGSQRMLLPALEYDPSNRIKSYPIPSYEVFNNDEQLLEAALNRMLHGLSSRDYRHGIEDYNNIAETSGRSKSTISRRFIKASAKEAQKILGRRFDDESISALMIDGIGFGDHTTSVALSFGAYSVCCPPTSRSGPRLGN